MFNPERRGGETGRTFESRLFGTAIMDPHFELDLEKLELDGRGRYRHVQKLYEAFKDRYLGADGGAGGSAERGETVMTTDLRQAVGDALGIEDDDEALKFYSAIGTPIDHKLGVDAFFELTDPETGLTARVTLDATLNAEKQKEGWKADVIVGALPDAAQESDDYLAKMDEIGKDIASKLQRRISDSLGRHVQRRVA